MLNGIFNTAIDVPFLLQSVKLDIASPSASVAVNANVKLSAVVFDEDVVFNNNELITGGLLDGGITVSITCIVQVWVTGKPWPSVTEAVIV